MSGSNRKTRPERNLNSTQYTAEISALKRFSPNLSHRTNLNETVGLRPGPSLDPKFKSKLSTFADVNYDSEYDAAYNDYLQALVKKQLVGKQVEEYKRVLEGQLVLQNQNLLKRFENLMEIVEDSESFRTKSEMVRLIELLQENYNSFVDACMKYNMDVVLDQLREVLSVECDKVILRNIKVIECREEYEKFFGTLEGTFAVTQKFIKSGRDFKEVHRLAESIRSLTDVVNNMKKSQRTVSELEKEAMYNFLQNVSDSFV